MNLYYIFCLNIIILKGLMEKYPARRMMMESPTGIRLKEAAAFSSMKFKRALNDKNKLILLTFTKNDYVL